MDLKPIKNWIDFWLVVVLLKKKDYNQNQYLPICHDEGWYVHAYLTQNGLCVYMYMTQVAKSVSISVRAWGGAGKIITQNKNWLKLYLLIFIKTILENWVLILSPGLSTRHSEFAYLQRSQIHRVCRYSKISDTQR